MAVAVAAPSVNSSAGDNKKHWWLTNKKIVDKYLKDARVLLATARPPQDQSQFQSRIISALNLLDAALELSPRLDLALQLKARSLLYLRRFKDVADMLQDYIPSLKMLSSSDDDDSCSSSESSSSSSSTLLSRERVMLLSSAVREEEPTFKCFSVSDLKKKVIAGLSKSSDNQGQCQWRYLVLGQACCHLGLMEDALVLLQTGKRLATAAFRRESICWSEDSFFFREFSPSPDLPTPNNHPATPPKTDSESISQLLSHIKLLLRRKTAAIAAVDAGLYSEAVRHFSKIIDGRRGAPQGFLAECYVHRASAYRSAGRIAEAIADCNKALALEPSCIEALNTRAALFETIRCLPDSLHDLEHLKLLYNSILRDRKLPGPVWRRQNVCYREIPGKLCSLATKIQELKQRVASGETGNVDYYALIGLRRGCFRSELERAHLLLTIKHKPDKSSSFIDRCEFWDEHDMESVRDRAKMSALLLYRLIQKGYTSIMTAIVDEEASEKPRKKAAAALQINQAREQSQIVETNYATSTAKEACNGDKSSRLEKKGGSNTASTASVFQGVFCRDLAVVGNLLSQVGFNRPIPVKYEGLSC